MYKAYFSLFFNIKLVCQRRFIVFWRETIKLNRQGRQQRRDPEQIAYNKRMRERVAYNKRVTAELDAYRASVCK